MGYYPSLLFDASLASLWPQSLIVLYRLQQGYPTADPQKTHEHRILGRRGDTSEAIQLGGSEMWRRRRAVSVILMAFRTGDQTNKKRPRRDVRGMAANENFSPRVVMRKMVSDSSLS